MNISNDKQLEVFCGTGGVGKSTMSAARAIALAKLNKKVLLITIDPSKRLKELFNLSETDSGQPHKVDSIKEGHLDILLMDPEKTFLHIAKIHGHPEVMQNRILKILSRPYGGLNEILSLIEINFRIKEDYDCIILDTAPGNHFLDFLEGSQKIKVFFDKSFIEIFQYLGKNVDVGNLPIGKRMVKLFVSKGVKKLLGYLKKVTGEKFINDFIEAIQAIYLTKKSFLETIDLENKLKNPELTNWFLVTSVEQSKYKEALAIKQKANEYIKDSVNLILNKSLIAELSEWNPEHEVLSQIKKNLFDRENALKENLKDQFSLFLSFPEIYSVDPKDHLEALQEIWLNQYMGK